MCVWCGMGKCMGLQQPLSCLQVPTDLACHGKSRQGWGPANLTPQAHPLLSLFHTQLWPHQNTLRSPELSQVSPRSSPKHLPSPACRLPNAFLHSTNPTLVWRLSFGADISPTLPPCPSLPWSWHIHLTLGSFSPTAASARCPQDQKRLCLPTELVAWKRQMLGD